MKIKIDCLAILGQPPGLMFLKLKYFYVVIKFSVVEFMLNIKTDIMLYILESCMYVISLLVFRDVTIFCN